MESRVEPAGPRRAILVVCPLLAAIISFQVLRVWLADYRVHTDRVDQMKRGVALEPANAAAWDRLGRVREADFENPDPTGAVKDFQEAVRRNPHSADYWMDLAGAYEATGNAALAREAFGRARAVYPASAQVSWIYGNFLLRQGDTAEGLTQIKHAVSSDPGLVPLSVSRIWHSSQDVELLLNEVLPVTEDAYFQTIDFLASVAQPTPALIVWQRILALGKPVELRRSFPLLELLIQTDRSEDAGRVWRQALAAAGLPHDEPANGSRVWNGNFAHDFENGGLDWRWNSPSGASLDFDAPPPPAGGRSLRLDFGGGANLDLTQPQQFVPVEPGQRYHFHALVRTEGITTESGILFAISDPKHNRAVNILTDGLTGSHVWTAADVELTAGEQTHFLLVEVRRLQSRMFENKLSGTVWIGNVTLIPANSEESPTPK